jgi:mono/diheme cytochrome c family protein
VHVVDLGENRMRRGWAVVLTVLAVVGVQVISLLAFRASGVMNVSAVGRPGKLERYFLGGIADRSVETHATPMQVDAKDPTLLDTGLRAYNELCVVCHSAPGLADGAIARGLNPPAPHLWSRGTQHMSDGELYWVIQNGIRMTGMPAFGPSQSDAELRSLVAFVRQLPSLGNAGYLERARTAGLTVPLSPGQGKP